mmetsp:Transcript_53282/g.165149  ORF Transcript_53282/g.165149 Transcript_53282/m.165149 type:complete len:93 (-) Transcript_53282:43-321(-)|eukprot:CAMPEP_0204583776 /NCGR_PEP_ID=MMETSP0661-20131031/45970_1 /ASSEMBLY_ACC=CAM_ASM_000606 /TAXON_ID=109239 /ORGANISM="Alexandrium margalefi, Strain AMGDE01CS-322" /LENGTH=92 /DNA_ID=CAMNT_0051593165 /DNA_START=68 /DNA_END=346 /DNA_ORIENTATION=-
MSGLNLFPMACGRDFILKLSVFFLLSAIMIVSAKVCPDIVDYVRDGLLQDTCHLLTFSIGVFACHLAVTPVEVPGSQPADNSSKIRVPLYLL